MRKVWCTNLAVAAIGLYWTSMERRSAFVGVYQAFVAGGVVWLGSMETLMEGPRCSGAADRRGNALEGWMDAVAGGDREAFGALYCVLFPLARTVVLRVVRDLAQAEEVAPEVIVEVWSKADRYCCERGSVCGRVTRIAQRRAVDRLRQYGAQVRREQRVAGLARPVAHDSVVDCVEHLLEHEQVRRSLGRLTELQGEAIAKTRIRDGLVRLRLELDR